LKLAGDPSEWLSDGSPGSSAAQEGTAIEDQFTRFMSTGTSPRKALSILLRWISAIDD
jgi:hypothetical protein